MWVYLALALRLSGTIDRIEGAWVVVEWSHGHFTDLPSAAFHCLPREGETVDLRIQSRPHGSALALPGPTPRLSTTDGLLHLPESARLRPGLRYSYAIRLSRETGLRSLTHTQVLEDKTHDQKSN